MFSSNPFNNSSNFGLSPLPNDFFTNPYAYNPIPNNIPIIPPVLFENNDNEGVPSNVNNQGDNSVVSKSSINNINPLYVILGVSGLILIIFLIKK